MSLSSSAGRLTCIYAETPINDVAIQWLTMNALELGCTLNLPVTRDMSMLDAAVLFVELCEAQQRKRLGLGN